MNNKKGHRHRHYNLLQSFLFAFSGILYALRHERNLRIHFIVGAYMLFFSRYYGFDHTEYALLLLTVGFVITCELLNTAIEKTVDVKTSSYHSTAKIAKDVAAGAVLVASCASVAVGVWLFGDLPVILRILEDIKGNPLVWIALAAASFALVFLPSAGRFQK